MSVRLKAIYRDGAFIPVPNGEELNVQENAVVEITVHASFVPPPEATRGNDRKRALQELFASWDAYPIRPDAPRLTRDEMHERR